MTVEKEAHRRSNVKAQHERRSAYILTKRVTKGKLSFERNLFKVNIEEIKHFSVKGCGGWLQSASQLP